MDAAEDHPEEGKRLATLWALDLLDSKPEESFDQVTRLAQRLFGTEMAFVSLIDRDRQWFKSRQGLEAEETAREVAFCAHAILDEETFVVENALEDPRFADNPLVVDDPALRFYAGVQLYAPNRLPLGMLCVVDTEERTADPEDLEALRDLATVVERELATRYLAVSDELTGLHNRRGFQLAGTQMLAIADRERVSVSLVFLDLDGLKQINDRFGHDAGDRAIRAGATVLTETLRAADLVARLGGDEFAALLFNVRAEDVARAIDRLDHAAEKYRREHDLPFDLRMSAGAVTRPPGGAPLTELVAEADGLMYGQKQARRSTRAV